MDEYRDTLLGIEDKPGMCKGMNVMAEPIKKVITEEVVLIVFLGWWDRSK
jgi:hypothetical protein